ncbi:E3 ubiquitin-protein ligase TRIM35-like [Pelmatolapia mariae]|uniref:E3 ubiquitin-protein ligase TRIM35-like n=1 Tax=Pelmatolapia mariae TaxID=158779 RepID=UPI003211E6A2
MEVKGTNPLVHWEILGEQAEGIPRYPPKPAASHQGQRQTETESSPSPGGWFQSPGHALSSGSFPTREVTFHVPIANLGGGPNYREQSHKVVPVEEAVSDLKEQLKSDLKSLQDKRNKYKQVEETYNEMREHMKKQLLFTERQIRAEFNKLHQILKEEEESRLAALREEEEQKGRTISREMKMIEEQISSLSDSICAVEEELQKHCVPFLSSYKDTQSRARAQSSVSDPQLVSGALIDVAKHLGNLSFRVWEKMKEKVHFSPVILDPNTAHPRLYLSDDLTSVRRGDTKQQLPDNPERNTYSATVFGSEGFSSGKHSWVVEMGDHPEWNTVTVKKSLQRIRVQLDYDRGEVSFYDPEDMTHIYTHRDTFTEKLFPYFSVGEAGDAKTSDIRICQTEI